MTHDPYISKKSRSKASHFKKGWKQQTNKQMGGQSPVTRSVAHTVLAAQSVSYQIILDSYVIFIV